MTEKAKKWTDASVESLLAIVGSESPVSVAKVEEAAAALEVTTRSIAAKLRQLDREVASLAKEKVSAFTEAEGVALAAFVNTNAGTLTYKQIAEQFGEGKFSAKQIQGKLLALELTGSVKAADKIEAAKTYSVDEEAQFVALANSGAFIEDIANALSKTIASIRGKALSLTRSGAISTIPAQRESYAKDTTDPVEALGEDISGMTVAEIAEKTSKTERGIRTMLTRRGIKVADYDGEQKRAKAEAKLAA